MAATAGTVMRRVAAACAAMLLAAPPATAEGTLETRSFEVRHRPVEDAYGLVWPLLSERADLRIVRAAGRLEVTDEPARLEQVAEALAAFDVAPRVVRLVVTVIKGEKRDAPPADSDPGVPLDVRQILEYNAYESLGSVEVLVRERGRASALLGDEGRLRVSLELGNADPADDRIELRMLSLERRLRGERGEAVFRPVFQVSDRLTPGKPRILCATPGGVEPRALFLLITGSVD